MARPRRRRDLDKQPWEWEEGTYRSLYTEFPTSLCIGSLQDGNILRKWVGTTVTEISGYTVEELEDDPALWFDIIHPADRDRVRAAYRRLAEGHSLFEEYRIFRKNGQMRWVRDDYAAARDIKGEMGRIIGLTSDVTFEKSALYDLALFKPMLDDAPAAVAVRDMAGRMVYCNLACARIYGYESPADMVGTSIYDVLPEDMRQEFEEVIQPKLFTGPWSGEIRLKRKDGAPVEVSISTNLLRGPADRPTAIYTILSDITERKRIEEQLALAQFSVDNAVDAVARIAPDGRFLYVNDTACRYLGYSREELLSMSAPDIDPNYTQGKWKQHWEELKQAGSMTFESSHRAKDGSTFPVEVTSRYLKFRGREYCFSSARDITKRKQAEVELQSTRYIIDHAAEQIYWLGSDGKFLYVNEAAARALGYTREELLSLTVSDIDPDFPPARWREHWEEVRDLVSCTHESYLRAKDGTLTPVELTINHVIFQGTEYHCTFGRDITERKRAQEALRQSEEKFRNIVESTHDWVWEVDENCVYTYVSPRARDLLGYEPEELLGRICFDLMPPDEAERVAVEFTPLTPARAPFRVLENKMLHRNGHLVQVEISAAPVFDENGKFRGYRGIDRDITERKQAEEALKRSEEKYRNLVERINDWVWEIDENDLYTFASPRTRDLLGYEPEEVLGKTPFDLMPPGEDERVSAIFHRIKERREPFTLLENALVRRDGRMVVVETNGAPFFDDQGMFRGYRGIDRDVTEACELRKIAEEALEMYRVVTENSPSGIIIVQNAQVVYANPKIVELVGYTLEEGIEMGVWQIVHPDDRERLMDYYERRMRGEDSPSEYEFRVITKSGDVRYFEMRASTVHYRGVPAVLDNIIDVTERKRAEQALAESEDLLRAVQDSLSANIAVLDKDGTIVAVNESWRQFARENGDPTLEHTGVGVNYLDVCRRARGERSEGAREALEGLQAILRGELAQFELEYPCPSPRHERWFMMRAAPLRSERGGLVTAHIDITERVRATRDLQESEEKYRTLAENVEAVIFRLDTEMRPITLAGNAVKISGYSSEELLSNPALWLAQIHPDDLARAKAAYRKMVFSRAPSVIETRIVNRSGETRWVRTHVVPRFDDSGNLLYYDGVGMDITERVEAQQREEKRAARMALLAEIDEVLGASLDFDEILRSTAKKLAESLNCLAAAIGIDPKTGKFSHIAAHHKDQARVDRANRALEQLGLAVISGFGAEGIRIIMTSDLKALSPQLAEFGGMADVGPAIWVPVYVGEELLCLLTVGRSDEEAAFNEEDLWLLTEVASHSSAALTRAALYRRQAKIAETLQRSLVPEEPKVKGLEVATCYIPATGEAEVGGDFYDVIEFSEDMVGIVVGDVSGKGLEAAIHTAQAKYMLRGFALQNPDPGFVMTELNRGLCAFTGVSTFVTLVYILIELSKHKFTYVNAGHEPSLVLDRETHSIRELKPNGLVLGVMDGQVYMSRSLTLEPTDLVFSYTDGVTDVSRDGERFGYERLIKTLVSAPVSHAQELLDYVMDVVREYGHGKHPDDQVLVAVRLENANSAS